MFRNSQPLAPILGQNHHLELLLSFVLGALVEVLALMAAVEVAELIRKDGFCYLI